MEEVTDEEILEADDLEVLFMMYWEKRFIGNYDADKCYMQYRTIRDELKQRKDDLKNKQNQLKIENDKNNDDNNKPSGGTGSKTVYKKGNIYYEYKENSRAEDMRKSRAKNKRPENISPDMSKYMYDLSYPLDKRRT